MFVWLAAWFGSVLVIIVIAQREALHAQQTLTLIINDLHQ
jgi:hypothetical protein